MAYKIIWSDTAEKDFEHFVKSGNKQIINKIFQLLDSLEIDPYSGVGKPEALKHQLLGFWSRRINKEHRLVYTISDENKIVEIRALKGHY